MEAPRLLCVALEDQLVVPEPRHELDDVDPSPECDVGDRRLGGVVALQEEDELWSQLVEEPLGRDDRGERPRQELRELRARLRLARIDRALMERSRERRQDVTPDGRAAIRELLQVCCGRIRTEDSGGLRLCIAFHVIVEDDEVADAEGLEVLPWNPAAGGNQDNRPPTRELKRLAEQALELQLVDEVGQAHDQDRRPGCCALRALQPGAGRPKPAKIALEHEPPAKALGQPSEPHVPASSSSGIGLEPPGASFVSTRASSNGCPSPWFAARTIVKARRYPAAPSCAATRASTVPSVPYG